MDRLHILKRLHDIMFLVLQQKDKHTAYTLKETLKYQLDQFPLAAVDSHPQAETMRYAVVAWIDDLLMNTPWPGQSEWYRHSLQHHYFLDHTAGDAFYTRLQGLRQQGVRGVHAVLIYYLCLEMGFLGCYRLAKVEMSALITNECAEFLNPLLPVGALPWQAPDRALRMKPRRAFAKFGFVLMIGVALLGFAALYSWHHQKLASTLSALTAR